MPTHQSLAGTSDEDLLQRMVDTHGERYGDAFWAFFTSRVAPSLPARPVVIDLGCGPGLFLRDLTMAALSGPALHDLFDKLEKLIRFAAIRDRMFDEATDLVAVLTEALAAADINAVLPALAEGLGRELVILEELAATTALNISVDDVKSFAVFELIEEALVVFDNLFSYVPLAAVIAMAHAASARPWKKVDALPVPASSTLDTMVAPVALVAGLVGRWVLLTRAARIDDVERAHFLAEAAGPFERMVQTTSPVLLLAGLATAWAQGYDWLGLTTGWMLLSILLVLPILVMIPTVFVPRGRAFETEMAAALAAGQVTPGLRAAWADPAVAFARRYELAAIAAIVVLMVLKPF